MKKTYIYIIIAVFVIAVIAALIVPQIISKKEVPVSEGLPTDAEMQAIEVSGDLQSEGFELNSIELRDADMQFIDAQIDKL